MAFFKRRKEEEDEFFFDTSDILIIFDDDKRTSDIKRISEIRDGTIYVTGQYAVPYEDCDITTGADGRNFFYKAPSESVKETQRLAELERNIVLSQITAYKQPVPPSSIDWTKGLLFGLVFVAFIIMGISSCGGGS